MQYQKEEIRARILEAALAEFEQHGFAGAQMRRMARRARVATGNIYRYFKNKEEIFDAIVQAGYRDISALIFESHQLSKQNRGDIRSIARHIASGIMGVYSRHGRQLLVVANKSSGSRHEDFLETLTTMVARRIREELYSGAGEGDDVLIHLIASGFVEGLFIILRSISDIQRIEELINRMLIFYFQDIECRLGVTG
ncbi:MAG TPA: hypothetical protein DEQ28_02220 [Clostridiales bacterium]|nr:hypothetical protein [Clostridiales bacterium]